MSKWHSKSLGQGTQVYQNVRDARHKVDSDVTADRLHILVTATPAIDTFMQLPPVNSAMAIAIGATTCAAPDLRSRRLITMSIQEPAIVPAFASDNLQGISANDC